MREIKFRAWDKINNKMYYPSIPEQEGFEIKGDKWAFCDFAIQVAYLISDNGELMQYTGLKDRKGKEIYEGDICRLIGSKYSFIVIYETMYASFRLKSILSEAGYGFEYIEQKIVVVGNVHENPELLK